MKIAFLNGSNAPTVLADNSLGHGILIESWGLSGVVERRAMAGAAKKLLIPHGNVDGPFIFTAQISHATATAAAAYFASQAERIFSQETVEIRDDADKPIAIMPDAILESIQRVLWRGAALQLRYTFAINCVRTTTNELT